jgi:glutamate/tyrosine decarboxylase-like PLP-dependent enzyme
MGAASRSDGPDAEPVGSPLDPPGQRVREVGAAAVEWVAAYLESIRDLPIAPRVSSAELKSRLAEPLPVEGRDFAGLLETFRDVVVAGARHNGHPRFFGYVSSPGTAIASVADFLASALNANLPAWRSAPAPTELERLAIDWIKQALGCAPGAGGLFTSGGSMANFTALAAARHRHCGGLWLHVDACYGGFARLAPSVRTLFDGLAEADSIALDPHKWLYLPADCGCVLYRDPAAVLGAFTLDADYTRVLQHDPAEAYAFWDYGPELTRRFRALKVWMTLAYAGSRVVGDAIESNLDCARYLAELVDNSDDFELLAPVELSIFCFRYLPPDARGQRDRSAAEERRLDRLNERIMLALQQKGSSYLSNATVNGRFALRGCVLNYRTTRSDMATLLQDVRHAAANA